jgi:hypothetical protein
VIAFFGTLAITAVANAAMWLAPLAWATMPPEGPLPVVRAFLLHIHRFLDRWGLCCIGPTAGDRVWSQPRKMTSGKRGDGLRSRDPR